jgi:hypothetical protein
MKQVFYCGLIVLVGMMFLFCGPYYSFEPSVFYFPFAWQQKPAPLFVEPANCFDEPEQNVNRKILYSGYFGTTEELTCGVLTAILVHDHAPWAEKGEGIDRRHVLVDNQFIANRLNRMHVINDLAQRYDHKYYTGCDGGRIDFGFIKTQPNGETYLELCGQRALEDFYLPNEPKSN